MFVFAVLFVTIDFGTVEDVEEDSGYFILVLATRECEIERRQKIGQLTIPSWHKEDQV